MAMQRELVMTALRTVQDPELFKDIVTLNVVKDVRLDGDHVHVILQLTNPASPLKATIQHDVETVLRRAGASEVSIEWIGGAGKPTAPKREVLPQVTNVIAVGAGKGGVGKSTIAANLAIGLQRAGHRVGLMDGDIYGPSMPTILGIKGLPPQTSGNKLLPFYVHGIYAVTIGALVEQDKPLIWRGPMAHGAFKQLLVENTVWPELDYLIVDLPPGTGDVPLTLCQLLPITGAVVVATPQQVALDDAVRAVRMFQQLNAPILGMVENMSYFVGPDGAEHDIFGRGGTERAAKELGLAYLGALPMFTELRVNSDAGKPIANFTGTLKLCESLEAIVRNLATEVTKRNQMSAGPTLTIR